MILYDLPAPAKLNLFLHVVGRRQDGYHLLESVFRLVSLADTVSIELRRDGVVSRESSVASEVAAADDLVVRAALALKSVTGTRLGAHIVVRKRVPMGAGLGGGSSDAATVLVSLNRLWRTGLRRQDLMRLALKLGADVPFFLFGQNAFVQGIGEQMRPVQLPDVSYAIFCPSVSVPTALVFNDHDLTRNTEPVKMSDFSGRARFIGAKDSRDDAEAVVAGSVGGAVHSPCQAGFGMNDLEAVVVRLFPLVAHAKGWLMSQGFQVRMSGSGSSYFAEFESPEVAELACMDLPDKMQSVTQNDCSSEMPLFRSVSVCDGLPSHPLLHWVSE